MSTSANIDMQARSLGGGFSFTGINLDRLGATEYTLVTITIDVSGSVFDFKDDLLKALITAIDSCKKSPRSENLLVRVVTFSTTHGILELHGFKPLSQIDPHMDYSPFIPSGGTPLFDATYSAVASMVSYGEDLTNNDYLCNALGITITDGDDTCSVETPKSIKRQIDQVKKSEKLESLVNILVGINIAGCKWLLEKFQQEASIDQFVDVGDATPSRLAKLANFISHSVSSQSQALGTGGPSKQIPATI